MRLINVFLIGLIFYADPAAAIDLTTSFEFNDSSDSFTLGDAPNTIVFSNGEAKSIGVLSLYHSGSRSWMIDDGNTGVITFTTPARELSFFIRSAANNTGDLRVYDSNDQLISTDNSTQNWLAITITISEGEPGIGKVEFQHTAGSSYVVLDDFIYTAEVPLPQDQALEDPLPLPIVAGMATVQLEVLATGLVAPNWGTVMPGNPDELMVVDQPGMVWAIHVDSGERRLFLDLSDRLVELGITGPESFDERGLLGLAFHPNYPENGLLYTYSSEPVDATADFSTLDPGIAANHQSVVIEWAVATPSDPLATVDNSSARILLRVDQPQFNHDGGCLAFGPDNFLYLAFGDGGGADDSDGQEFIDAPITGHGDGNGQNAANLLGTLLRIDVAGNNSSNGMYGIPADNPFVADTNKLDEIFAYGFRNPFRFSIDSKTSALYVADVGQNDIEEINRVSAGGNYGWNLLEGSFSFRPNGNEEGFVLPPPEPVIEGLSLPIAQYDHDEGVAIIGGFVNNGDSARQLRGLYVFGDYSGRLFYLTADDIINEVSIEGIEGSLDKPLLGFGQDARGNLYLMSNASGLPFGNEGTIYRLLDSSDDNAVQKAYIAYYGRPADSGGQDFWVTQLMANDSKLSSIINTFGNSAEFNDRFGMLSNSQLIDNIYQQLFARAPDAGGKQFYLDSLNSEKRTLQNISLAILSGAKGNDALIIANKLAVSRRFTANVDDSSFEYNGIEAANAAKALLDQVNTDLEHGFQLVDSFLAGDSL